MHPDCVREAVAALKAEAAALLERAEKASRSKDRRNNADVLWRQGVGLGYAAGELPRLIETEEQ